MFQISSYDLPIFSRGHTWMASRYFAFPTIRSSATTVEWISLTIYQRNFIASSTTDPWNCNNITLVYSLRSFVSSYHPSHLDFLKGRNRMDIYSSILLILDDHENNKLSLYIEIRFIQKLLRNIFLKNNIKGIYFIFLYKLRVLSCNVELDDYVPD